MRAFLLAIPLMTCSRGVHVPEGGGQPVRQKMIRADKHDNRGEPTTAQAQAPAPEQPSTAEPTPVEPPPRVATRPRRDPPKAEPPPVRRDPPRIAERPRATTPIRPSADLCGEISPQLSEPKPMSDDERKPLTDVVGRHIGEIRACYEEARVRAHADGCMFAVFTVDSLGQLREPYIDTSNIEDATMQNCVAKALGSMELRAPIDDVVWSVLYPFFFEGGEIFHSSQHLPAG
jgi:hypothetical protein